MSLTAAAVCSAALALGAAPAALAAAWAQTAKLLAGDSNALDELGDAVAIDGERLVVGAPSDDEAAPGAGAAYVFERDGEGRWVEVEKLLAPDADHDWTFGAEVAIHGNIVAATAPNADPIGLNETGAAYIFERDASGAWRPATKLKQPDGEGRVWGSSVGVDGDRIAIGAVTDEDGDPQGGSVYVFERDASGSGNWSWVAKLIASDSDGFDHLGSSVAVDGDRVVAGAPGDDGVASDAGAAYVFDRGSGGEWIETAKLTASDGDSVDRFGASVGIDQDRIIVGADWDEDRGNRAGSAYVFERDRSGAWIEVRKLLGADTEQGDNFGHAVGIDQDLIVVGAYGKYLDGVGYAGAAYVFERDHGGAGQWGEAAKLVAADPKDADSFAFSVGTSGSRVVAGSVNDDDGAFDAGAAYVFVRVEPRLAVVGTCPGIVTVGLSGATPKRQVLLLGSTREGSTAVPFGPCAGTEIDLAKPKLLALRRADADGELALKRTFGIGTCGSFLQVLDGFTCEASDVERLP